MREALRRFFHHVASCRHNFCSSQARLILSGALLLFVGALMHAQAPVRLTHPIDPARTQVLPQHHPLWANAANDAGRLPADQELGQLTLVLTQSAEQKQAFDQLVADQQNPASPTFHQWLTPAEIGERFGLSDADIDVLTGWLQSQGLRVDWVAPSRLFIGFSGTAANVEQAFGAEIHAYAVNGEQRFSVASEPTIPQAVAPAIQAVRGLYTIQDRPLHHLMPVESSKPEVTTSGGGHYIGPADFNTIYDVPAGLTGAGQKIGIVGEARTNFADFDNFRLRTGATFANPTEIVPTTFGGVDPGPACTVSGSTTGNCASTGNQSEATLDVLRTGSVAPAANLLLVVASAASGGVADDVQYLVNTTPVPANVMSISFGSCESGAGQGAVTFWDHLFQQAAAEGISVFVSSGDSGASGCDAAFTTPPVSPQANSPNSICSSSYVTCVGGTEFNDTSNPATYWNSTNGSGLLSALSYIPEGAWNEPGTAGATQIAATGGGVSAFIATPSWQTGTGVPSARAGRYTPDVSFSGACHDGYFACMAAAGASCTGSPYQFLSFCGTSASAPGMAGVAALLDQRLGSAQGNLNPQIYQEAANAPAAFHDTTVASSGVSSCSVNTPSMCNNSAPGPSAPTGGQAGFLLTTGYDEVTGLGSLDVAQFLNNYAAVSAFTITGTNVTVARGATTGNTSTITVTPLAGFTGAVTLTATVTSSPAGAQNPPTVSFGSTGTVNITGTNPGTATLTISTTAAQSGALEKPASPMMRRYGAGGAVLACLLLLCVPVRKRNWRSLLGLAVLAVMMAGVQACSSGPGATSTGTTKVTPTVTVTPTPASITTAQSLSVKVAVTGGSTTPTGTISLVSGNYTAPSATLSSGSATITIPPNTLSAGNDPLNASYAPDSASAPTFNYGSGSGIVIVTSAASSGTTPGNYTITITGTSGSLMAASTITLTVQ
ncbi:MAG TPA: S53 family peptidase [Terracidiphilus sp.]|nr:S53 family peptidase [Terracidiphilus sp.]